MVKQLCINTDVLKIATQHILILTQATDGENAISDIKNVNFNTIPEKQ